MEKLNAVAALAALAQESRLDVFRLLVQAGTEGLPAGKIAETLNLPSATLSFHLNQLKHAGLVTFRRESRSLIYAAEYAAMNDLLAYLTENCCQGDAASCGAGLCDTNTLIKTREKPIMSDQVYNIMFLCTGNTARSIMAEAILRRDGAAHFRAFSAGSHPKGEVNPFAIKVLESYDYPTTGLRSKSWDEFSGRDAPVMDFVFTVCDNAAAETCPVWPGHPMTAHWGIDDPAAATGPAIETEKAFVEAFKYLKTRIGLFLSLPLVSIDKMALGRKLREIGETEGASIGHGKAG